MKHFAVGAGLLLSSIIFLAGCGAGQNGNQTKNMQAQKTEAQQPPNTAPAKPAADNTIDNAIKTNPACGTDPGCFQSKFSACEPATFTAVTEGKAAYAYEITGPKKDGCEMKTYFTIHPTPAWVGKSMTCLYDNKKDFSTATQDVMRRIVVEKNKTICTGPLADLILSQ